MHNIDIGKKNYELRYSVNALSDLEERCGKGCGELVDDMAEGRLSAIRWLFWGGLRDKQPELSLAAAGELLEEHLQQEGASIEALSDMLSAAMMDSGFFKSAARAAEAQQAAQGKAAAKPPIQKIK